MAAAVVLLQAAASAQDASQSSGQPARAVRLSYVDGQVKLSQGDQVLADKAVVNTPLFEGMQLTTADDGKAEIEFEDGSVARLAPDSSLTLSVLHGSGASADAELNLNVGLAYFEFQGGGQAGQFSVRFGSSVATPSGFTALRVDIDSPPGSLAVFSGNAHIEVASNFGAGITADLHGGESIALNPADPSNYSLTESIDTNSWDAWSSDRDQELTAEATAQTSAPVNLGATQNPAWADLDANGSWYDVPGQGYVWSPYDAENAGFDPYGNGAWTYTPSYGYVWASGYPWGYVPYQCGAWNFYDGFGWGWVPGMGGCNPWWGLGVYGGPNIGVAPVGYRPIPRPPVPPHWPIGHRPIPLVPVHRHTEVAGQSFPARNRTAQVTIAGSAVHAMQPLASRQEYRPEVAAFPGAHGTEAPGNAFSNTDGNHPEGETVTRPGYAPPSTWRSGSAPPAATAPANHSYTPPPHSSSGGGSSSHSSGSSASHSGGSSGGSHSSGGGGGGGGSHSSGGGGGGGGSHSGGH